MVELRLGSMQDTKRLGLVLSKFPWNGRVIGLSGSLGSGKTTFTRELVVALGSVDQVSSPTFVLCNEYKGKDIAIEHWDLYRLSAAPSELFEETKALRIVEWPERGLEKAQSLDLLLTFSISFEASQEASESRIVRIEGLLKEQIKKQFLEWR